MFSILTDWSVFKNKICEYSLSDVKFVDTSKLVTGPFKTHPNSIGKVCSDSFLRLKQTFSRVDVLNSEFRVSK